jgi:undecaprenyl-diphosphatase
LAAQDTPHGPNIQPMTELSTRTRTDPGRASALAWPIVALLGLGGFTLMTWLIAGQTIFPFDQPLLDAGQRLSPYMDAWHGLSESANFPLIAVGIAIVVGLLLFHRWREAIVVVVLLVAVTVGSEIIKQLVARPRPPGYDESTVGIVYSFPSGHVLEAVTMYGIIAVLVWRSALPAVLRVLVPLVFLVVVILVGIARVAVAAHYPSDVLASALAGIGCVALFAWSSAVLTRRRSAAENTPTQDS